MQSSTASVEKVFGVAAVCRSLLGDLGTKSDFRFSSTLFCCLLYSYFLGFDWVSGDAVSQRHVQALLNFYIYMYVYDTRPLETMTFYGTAV